MSVATSPRPKPDAVPDHPGVYLFRDTGGRVIYVGKAISLRKRTASYFQPLRNLHPRTAAMVDSSATLEWVLVQNEVEALQLEYNLIKQHRPRYNVRYRDDKSYPWLAVTVSEEIPRPRVERGAKRKGTRYFGPYAHAYAIRETLDLLLRTFPMRTCSQGVFDRQRRRGRPCILYDINKCSGPCVGHISPEGHRAIVDEFISFMEGHSRPVLRRLEAEMREAAEQLNFEAAARLRDQLASVRKAMERQQMVSSSPENFDIAAFAEDDLEAAVQVFFVRRGRVVGQRGFVVDKVEELDGTALAATFVQQLYGERLDEVPREVLLPVLPEGADALRQWLSGVRGGPVDFRVPQRGEKRALLETVTANARALKELQEQLDLPVAPLRIECYDISNLQGSQVVGSMVVFEDGLPRKSEYRRFEVRTVDGQDDFASLREVLSRRLARLASEQDDHPAEPAAGAPAEVEPDGLREAADASAPARPETPKQGPRKFAYPPSLIVVDGGRPQLGAAMEALEQAGRTDLAVIGLAKRMDEVAYQRNDLDAALEHVTEGIARCRQLNYTQPLATGLATLAWIRQAQGDPAGALEAIGEAARVASGPGVAGLLNVVPAQRARLLVAQGDVVAADRWTRERGLGADDQVSYPREPGYLVLARVLLARDRPEHALGLLERLHALAVAQGRVGSLIEIQALRALALAGVGEEAGAVAALVETLTLARPEGYVRVFADQGAPMGALLGRLVAAQRTGPTVAGRVPLDYLGRLVRAFQPATAASGPRSRPSTAVVPGLVEPLSERELEVLRLLAVGKPNQQIAEELVVAVNTVKKHVAHLLAKLGAANRTEATARARQLGLLR